MEIGIHIRVILPHMNSNEINDGFVPAPTPTGMDAPQVPILHMGPAPEPLFEDSVCLKGKQGKCQHLWQMVTSFAHGNPLGTFEEGAEPKAIHRSCLRGRDEMDLKGLKIISCSEHTDDDFKEDPKPFVFPEIESVEEAPTDVDIDNLPTVNLGATSNE